jgi:hypothetical protein
VSTHEPQGKTSEEDRAARPEVLSADEYDLIGYRAVVTAAPDAARTAVRGVLGGFGPLESGASSDLPRYDLAAAPTGGWTVTVDDTVVHASDSLPTALGFLEWRMVTAALDHRRELFHLHGGALCAPTRRAGVVLAGDSGSGKTTLTLSLMLRGFVPFGDDVALIDPGTLELQVLRRAFHTDEGTWRLLAPLTAGAIVADADGPEGYFSPPQWAERPVPVEWLLFLDYRAGQDPKLVRLTPPEAAAGILANTVSLASNSRLALRAAARLTAQAACYRLHSGNLAATVDMVQQLVAVGSPSSPRA